MMSGFTIFCRSILLVFMQERQGKSNETDSLSSLQSLEQSKDQVINPKSSVVNPTHGY